MIANDRQAHWNRVYSTRAETDLSWYQAEPRLSIDLIASVAPENGGRVVDVGGGASVLVDRLLDLRFVEVAVLDLAQTALDRARDRLGERAGRVRWLVADILEDPDLGTFDIWHDRAVFHFLTDPADRRRYVDLASRTVPVGGHLILATFADDGPSHCSGLDVCRYNARSLADELGGRFAIVREARERHRTPGGGSQPFLYGLFERRADLAGPNRLAIQ